MSKNVVVAGYGEDFWHA